MNDTNIQRDQSEEESMLTCDISDEALEKAAGTVRDNGGNITWYYCPTGLTYCRF
jgi:hypothetical protein